MGKEMSLLSRFIICLGLASPLVLYAYQQTQRPPHHEINQPLFQGIDYQRLVMTTPRPNVLHVITIDLSTPGIIPWVTSPQTALSKAQASKTQHPILAQTTGEFVETSGVQIGINGNYFYEFREKTPWDFYPHSGNPVYAVGESINGGDRYGTPRDSWPALCFSTSTATTDPNLNVALSSPKSYYAHIAPEGHCPPQTIQAIAGRDLLVENGQPLTTFPNITQDKPYSRAAVGIDQSGQSLWLVIIDGKQPRYSEGMLLNEVAQFFADLGVDGAIALDGGGSSTLVINPGVEPQLFNTPMHVKWPNQERAIANHLGFYALPLNPTDRY